MNKVFLSYVNLFFRFTYLKLFILFVFNSAVWQHLSHRFKTTSNHARFEIKAALQKPTLIFKWHAHVHDIVFSWLALTKVLLEKLLK